MGLPNPSRETKFSGPNEVREEFIFPVQLADHEQDWQPYPFDPYTLAKCDDHTYIHQIQPEYGDEQADAGWDCRNRLARPNSQARTGTG